MLLEQRFQRVRREVIVEIRLIGGGVSARGHRVQIVRKENGVVRGRHTGGSMKIGLDGHLAVSDRIRTGIERGEIVGSQVEIGEQIIQSRIGQFQITC